MKTLLSKLSLAVIFLLFSFTGQAQTGGFGHFYVGPAIGNYTRLQRDLQQYHLLGPDFGLSTTGFMIGGGGMASLDGLLLGGNGFAAQFGSAVNAKGEAELSTAAGFFNIGYAIHNTNGWILYPYAGVGGSRTELKLTNASNNAFTFDYQHSLQPGQSGNYSVSGIAVEGGVGLKKLIARKDRKSGLMVGLEAGTYGLPTFKAWKYEGSKNEITGLTATHSQAYYVRFSFGGGWY